MKRCFKCGYLKEYKNFYKHKKMADGYLNKCKECAQKDIHENYFKRHEYYLEYDKKRNKTDKRKKRSKLCVTRNKIG